MQLIRKNLIKERHLKDHDFHHFLSFHDVERRPKDGMVPILNGTPEKSKNLFDKFVPA